MSRKSSISSHQNTIGHIISSSTPKSGRQGHVPRLAICPAVAVEPQPRNAKSESVPESASLGERIEEEEVPVLANPGVPIEVPD